MTAVSVGTVPSLGTDPATGKPITTRTGAVRWADGTVTYGSVACQPNSSLALAFKPDPLFASGLCVNGRHPACPGMIAQPRLGGKVQVALCGCNCGHPLASDVANQQTVGGYRCTKCSTRRPMLQTRYTSDLTIPDVIDPQTGACVDRDTCGQLVAHKLDTSPLRTLTGRNHVPKNEDGTAAPAAEKPARTPRVKDGKCEHCGVKTNGGKFAPGHDAQLKSTLIRTYANVEAPSKDRVQALAEAISRGWLKNRSAHDIRPLMKGVKEEDAKKEIASDFDKLVEQADALVAKDTAEVVIKRRTAERVQASA